VTASLFGVPDGGKIQSNGGTQSYYAPNSGASEIGYQGTLNFRAFNVGSPLSAMFLTSGGNVLIGTTTDTGYKLQVSGIISINGNNYLDFGNGDSRIVNTSGVLSFQTYDPVGLNFGTRMTILGNGNVGIRNTNPAGKLSVNDSTYGEYLRIVSGLIGGNETSVYLAWNNGGSITLQQVVVGAADSGGTGFRLLRIPNT
jgi:hypothetical protein